jgi:hypothetical protein
VLFANGAATLCLKSAAGTGIVVGTLLFNLLVRAFPGTRRRRPLFALFGST